MLSPGAAFLLAYVPSRQLALIEASLVAKANEQLVRTATKAGIVIPGPGPDLAAWLAAIEAAVRPLRTTPLLQLAWSAGELARTIEVAGALAAQVAYLRAAAPEHPELRAEAEARAAELRASVAAYTRTLERTGLPIVIDGAGHVARLLERTGELAPTTADGFRKVGDFARTVGGFIEANARDLAVPPPAQAASPPTAAELAALAAILAEPWNDAPRLELARLAATRGDPRAELIREQLAERDARAAGNTIDALGHLGRANVLVRSHPEWTAPLRDLGARDVRFERGFPAEITIDAEPLLAHGRELLALAPITALHVRSARGRIAELVRAPLLATIELLDLDDQGVTDADLEALAASPHVSRLRQLDLRFNLIGARGIEALAASTRLGALAQVNLGANPADPVDRLEYYDETHQHRVPTAAGQALEAKYGPLRWLHPESP